MTKPTSPFQVPEEIRSMIDQGVSQAREGFGKVLGAASEAAASIETKSDAAAAQAAELRRKGLALTETSVNAAFDLAQKMVSAKSIEEIVRLQTEFMSGQFETFRSHMQQAGAEMQKQGQAMATEMMGEATKVQAKAKAAMAEGVAAVSKATRPKKG
ncbi:MAG: phasin family protein [Beijerinckiaceae bacterium]|jgi:phasin|nr:phasin family protein [Beijerinckiaceae bacterium]